MADMTYRGEDFIAISSSFPAATRRGFIGAMPANRIFSWNEDLPPNRGLYVGVTGNVFVEPQGAQPGVIVPFTNVTAGTFLPIGVRQVINSAGYRTTAADIILTCD